MNSFAFVVVTPAATADAALAIAACRAGEWGVLDLTGTTPDQAQRALHELLRFTQRPAGLRIDGQDEALLAVVAAALTPQVGPIILSAAMDATQMTRLGQMLAGRPVWVEAADVAQAQAAEQLGASALVIRETTPGYTLTQQVRAQVTLPLYVGGQVNLHALGDLVAAGADGVILDRQLALVYESNLSPQVQQALRQQPDQAGYADWSAEDIRLARQLADDYRTVGGVLLGLRAELEAQMGEGVEKTPAYANRPSQIAIIGMETLLPKANSKDAFWENVLNAVYALTEIPRERWDYNLFFDPDRTARDKIYSKWGGFLGDVPFDPMEFGMPPNSLKSIDPMQLLALKVAKAALGDAGYLGRPFDRSRTGVILGASGGTGDLGGHYLLRSSLPLLFGAKAADLVEAAGTMLPEWTEDSFAGLLLNVAAGRITNRLDLGGVNYIVDAACASSLTAVHLACKELETHNADMIIVGGVDTVQNPFGYLCFSKTQALSPNGTPRTFDEDSDGITIAEGIVMLVLKRLEDAERDGDRIYAVIQGVSGSSDGKAKGMTAPRPEGQVLALQRTYEKAGYSPTTVELFEAHGTGTAVGDRTEAVSLGSFLQAHGALPNRHAVGSVKSMIGHTKATAGVAALVKAALAVYHKVLPPTLGVSKPNPAANFSTGPLYVNSETRPWVHATAHPRRAGVSAFGFGGTNFHVTLEEYTGDFLARRPAVAQQWPAELLIWGGRNHREIETHLQGLQQALAQGAQPTLAELAYSLWQAYRSGQTDQPYQVRLAIVAHNRDDLREKIDIALPALSQGSLTHPKGISYSDRAMEGKLAFLFPGQGSQYVNMLRDLTLYFSELREAFELSDRVLAGRYDRPLSLFVFPPPAFDDATRNQQQAQLTATNVAQPALGAANMGAYRLLTNLGLHPDLAGGHSYGEYTALWAAGVFDAETLPHISEARGRCMIEAADDLGGMAAATASEAQVRAVIESIPEVWVANLNAPTRTIISGSQTGLAQAMTALQQAGIQTQRLTVHAAFHSPIVAPAQEQFAKVLDAATFRAPAFPVYSNTIAARHSDDPQAIRQTLEGHLAGSVRFVEEIEAMYADGARIFLEVGPRTVMASLTSQILGARPHVALSIDQPRQSGVTSLLQALGQLLAHGVSLDLDRLFAGRSVRLINLKDLVRDTQPAPLPATTWYVNGGHARPYQQSAPVYEPLSREQLGRILGIESAPTAPADRPGYVNGGQPAPTANLGLQTSPPPATNGAPPPPAWANGPATPRPAQAGLTPTAHQPAPPPWSSLDSGAPPVPSSLPPTRPAVEGDATAVMLQFQQLMGRFLDTQRSVMLTYLQGSAAPTNGQLPGLTPTIIQHEPTQPTAWALPGPAAFTPQPVPQPLPTPAAVSGGALYQPPTALPAAPTPVLPSRRELQRTLFEIVGERTGYPPEMLDPNVDIEAELGIDSIKRVEILGAFQKQALPADRQITPEQMDELTSLKTLGGIVDWIDAALQAAVAASNGHQPAAGLPSTPAPVLPSRAELQRVLFEIVGERTGYPPEMLDPNVDIEAELGIDSIKRVEILGAFQKQILGEGQEIAPEQMDELTSLKTLGGIVDWIDAALRAAVAPGVSYPPAAGSSSVIPVKTGTHIVLPPRADLQRTLFEIVAERTGYPPEMLDPNVDIEAELGIDSIKRVEILGAFQKQVLGEGQEIAPEQMDELTSIKTLGGIVDWLVAAMQAAVAGSADPVSTGVTSKPASDLSPVIPVKTGTHTVLTPRSFLAPAAAAPPTTGPFRFSEQHIILLTDDEQGVALGLCQELERVGARVVMLRFGETFARPAANLYQVNLMQPQEVTRVVEAIRAEHGPVGGVVHLLPLAGMPPFEELELTTWKAYLRRDVKSLFFLAKAVAADLHQAPHPFLMGVSTSSAYPGQAGVTGFLKTAAKEWERVRVQAIDVDPDADSAQLAAHLWQELTALTPATLARYRAGERQLFHQVVESVDTGQPHIELGREDVILVTGGARGITARVAHHLAERYGVSLILVGRSPLPAAQEDAATAGVTDMRPLKTALMQTLKAAGQPAGLKDVERAYNRLLNDREMRQNLADMAATGVQMHYVSADAGDEAAMRAALTEAQAALGPITGVIHGAGVIEDKLIVDKAYDSFDRVFDTKADSVFILTRLLDLDRLKFMALFSSAAGALGNRGQSDYAATNDILNKLAGYLDQRHTARVTALCWGPWAKEGMVTPELRQQFEAQGIHLIEIEDGCLALDHEIRFGRKGQTEIIYAGGAWGATATPPPSLTRDQERPTSYLNGQTRQPLLTGATIQRQGQRVELIRTLDLAHDRYLDHHRLDGKPVLPAAVAMELMLETANYGWPDRHVVGLRDVRVLKGVKLEGDAPRSIRIVASPQASDPVTHIDLQITDVHNHHLLHYRATALLSDQPLTPVAFSAPTPTTAFPLSVAEAYNQWLFHGPVFQAITHIDGFSDRAFAGDIRPSTPQAALHAGVPGEWLLDPVVVDCGLQMSILWARARLNMTTLIAGVQRLQRYGSLSAQPVKCYMTIRQDAGGRTLSIDYAFVDPAGRLVVLAEGVEFPYTEALNRLAGKEVYAA